MKVHKNKRTLFDWKSVNLNNVSLDVQGQIDGLRINMFH